MQSPKTPFESGRPQRGSHRLELDTATAAEMREFLAEMHELHPQQVMGVGTPGGLVSGMVAATVGTVALMAALTVGPYFWVKFAATPEKAQAAAAAEKTAADKAEKPADTAEKAPSAVASQPAGEQPVADKTPAPALPNETGQPLVSKTTLERLGVDEVKTSDPNVNPLDSKIDDLLDKAK